MVWFSNYISSFLVDVSAYLRPNPHANTANICPDFVQYVSLTENAGNMRITSMIVWWCLIADVLTLDQVMVQ